MTYDTLKAGDVSLVLQTELGKTDCAGAPALEPEVVNGTIRIDVNGDAYWIMPYGSASPANGGPTKQVSYACTLSGGCVAGATPRPACCRVCTNGKPYGDTCIAATSTCTTPPGCACAQ